METIQEPELHTQKSPRKAMLDWLQIVIACSVAVLLFVFLKHTVAQEAQANQAAPPMPVAVDPAQAMGKHPLWKGRADAPYTLVEFADYQCPPCKYANQRVEALLHDLSGKVRFTFRNYPLTRIHLFAQPASVAAEISRQQGKFWPVHDALYAHQADLHTPALNKILEEAGVHDYQSSDKIKRALQAVEQDKQDGDACEVQATPTFVLCCPDGKVVRLGDLEQSRSYIR